MINVPLKMDQNVRPVLGFPGNYQKFIISVEWKTPFTQEHNDSNYTP